MKKTASISIDLRKSSLVRVEDNSNNLPQNVPSSIKKKQTNHEKSKIFTNDSLNTPPLLIEHKKETSVISEHDPKKSDAPTTIIHLKMIAPSNEEKKEEEEVANESQNLDTKSCWKNKISDVKKLMDEVTKERFLTSKKLENDRIKEFEINRQLERLRSETKKNVKKHVKNALKSHRESPKNEEQTHLYSDEDKSSNQHPHSENNVKMLSHFKDKDELNGTATQNVHNFATEKYSRKTNHDSNFNEKLKKAKHLKKDQIDKLISHLTASDTTLSLNNNFQNNAHIQSHKNDHTSCTKLIDSSTSLASEEDTAFASEQDSISKKPSSSSTSRSQWLRGPASYKRRCLSSKGPLSKRLKLLSQHGVEVDQKFTGADTSSKWLLINAPAQQHYHNGEYIYKDLPSEWKDVKESVSVCLHKVGDEEEEDEDEIYSQIGNEALKLGNLSSEDINELKKQVKEEQRHKEHESIMPILLNMSCQQLQSPYNHINHHRLNDDYGVQGAPLPDITTAESDRKDGWDGGGGWNDGKGEDDNKVVSCQNEDDDDIDEEEEADKDDVENKDEEEEEDVEFKSLDALYQEEFSKSGYKKLLDQLANDPYQLDKSNFWQEHNYDYKHFKDGIYYDSKPLTDYSKSRPKRSSVDYSPSAFTVIRYMEGGRPCRKGPAHRRVRTDVVGAVSSDESVTSEEGVRRSRKSRKSQHCKKKSVDSSDEQAEEEEEDELRNGEDEQIKPLKKNAHGDMNGGRGGDGEEEDETTYNGPNSPTITNEMRGDTLKKVESGESDEAAISGAADLDSNSADGGLRGRRKDSKKEDAIGSVEKRGVVNSTPDHFEYDQEEEENERNSNAYSSEQSDHNDGDG